MDVGMDPPALVAGPSPAGWCLQPHTVSISLFKLSVDPPFPSQAVCPHLIQRLRKTALKKPIIEVANQYGLKLDTTPAHEHGVAAPAKTPVAAAAFS